MQGKQSNWHEFGMSWEIGFRRKVTGSIRSWASEAMVVSFVEQRPLQNPKVVFQDEANEGAAIQTQCQATCLHLHEDLAVKTYASGNCRERFVICSHREVG
jgi:hypothetical protein